MADGTKTWLEKKGKEDVTKICSHDATISDGKLHGCFDHKASICCIGFDECLFF